MDEEMRRVDGNPSDTARDARKRVKRAQASGEPVTLEDMLATRGLILGERENSIFSDAWVPLAVIFVMGGFVLNRNLSCMALGVTLLLMAGVGRWWRNRSLDHVAYQRQFDQTHVFPSEPVEMTLTIMNRKWLPLTWLQFSDKIQGPVRVTAEHGEPVDSLNEFTLVNTFAINAHEQLERRVLLQYPSRGFYTIGPVLYEAGDLFTLFTKTREYASGHTLIVYPQIWPLTDLGLPAKEPFGNLHVRRSLFTDPIKTRGIRDYQPQDRFRDIHWKATARRGALQTKVYDPSTSMTAAVFLNISTAERYWFGGDPELRERLIAVAASMLNYGHQQDWGIGVYANGSIPRSDQPIRVLPSRAPDQLMMVLEALAAVTGYATSGIESVIRRESPNVPWAATLIVVTAVVSEALLVTLEQLQHAGRRVVLITLSEDPPPELYGIITYHIPPTVAAFQPTRDAASLTEAALQSVPTPSAVVVEQVS